MAFNLRRTLSRIYKPVRDSGRVERVFREFDRERGFGEFNAICQSAFQREMTDPGTSDLTRNGFEYLPVLPAHQAQTLLDQLTMSHGVASIKKDNAALEGFKDIDKVRRNSLIETVLTPNVDDAIARFFGSEYLVLWMTVSATRPVAGNEVVSFKWHCDKGPKNHLKLMVYLNSSYEHGGNTEFIPLGQSRQVASRGYIFGRTRSRTDDVNYLARLAKNEITPVKNSIAAGGGVLFQPATVLHRGVAPSQDIRYAITLCLLPSPLHWREALARDVIYDLGRDDKWPAHASDLLQQLTRDS